MRRVFVCSPLRPRGGMTVRANIERARYIATRVLARGDAPFVPHLLYPQFLDEDDPVQRDQGITAGCCWMADAHLVVVDAASGISEGMEHELAEARARSVPVMSLSDYLREEARPDGA